VAGFVEIPVGVEGFAFHTIFDRAPAAAFK
jgi:hypothetical protein